MERKTLSEITAAQLSAGLSRYAGRRRLTITRLARDFAVSPRTMWKAVRILQDRGMVTAHPRRGISIPSHADAPPAAGRQYSERDAAGEFAGELEERIRTGVYRSGRPLPKNLYFVYEEHRSPLTVSRAQKILAEKNLIHKKGKKWIAGPRETPRTGRTDPGPQRDAPVVLVVLSAFQAWLRICQNQIFAASFFTSLDDELSTYGYCIQVVMFNETKRPGRPFPSGKDDIRHLVASLGRRFAGSVIYTPPKTGEARRIELCRWLLAFGKPVMLFDLSPLSGREHAEVIQGGRRGRLFFHCFFNELAGDYLALDTVVGRGHTVIGMPRTATPLQSVFPGNRVAILEEYAKRRHPAVTLVVRDQPEQHMFSPWSFPWSTPGTLFSQILSRDTPPPEEASGRGRRRIPSHRQLLFSNTPSMVGLLNEDRVTAIIAANDSLAMAYFHWACEVGLSIPGDFSLISFDNRRELATYPISSIDFGLRDLGYRAAHAIIRDFPPKSDDATGAMHSKPFLVDRGSIGRPGTEGG